jgi:uncharacterized membrane protein
MSIFNKFIPKEITIVLFLAIFLNLLRIILFKSDSFVWLFWNIFLALIPFAISYFLFNLHKKKKLEISVLIVGSIIWLLFLPNAPYLITDLIHINVVRKVPVLFDSFLLFTIAWTGLYLWLHSVFYMEKIFLDRYVKKTVSFLIIIITILTSFGIYLGRFMRFNSWDVFTNPSSFSNKLFSSLSEPLTYFEAPTYIEAFIYTILFSIFLFVFYQSFKYSKIK